MDPARREHEIIAAVRKALVDESPMVRAAAAQTFDACQRYIGSKAIDLTIPTLLDALHQPGGVADAALAALREMSVFSSFTLFPHRKFFFD